MHGSDADPSLHSSGSGPPSFGSEDFGSYATVPSVIDHGGGASDDALQPNPYIFDAEEAAGHGDVHEGWLSQSFAISSEVSGMQGDRDDDPNAPRVPSPALPRSPSDGGQLHYQSVADNLVEVSDAPWCAPSDRSPAATSTVDFRDSATHGDPDLQGSTSVFDELGEQGSSSVVFGELPGDPFATTAWSASDAESVATWGVHSPTSSVFGGGLQLEPSIRSPTDAGDGCLLERPVHEDPFSQNSAFTPEPEEPSAQDAHDRDPQALHELPGTATRSSGDGEPLRFHTATDDRDDSDLPCREPLNSLYAVGNEPSATTSGGILRDVVPHSPGLDASEFSAGSLDADERRSGVLNDMSRSQSLIPEPVVMDEGFWDGVQHGDRHARGSASIFDETHMQGFDSGQLDDLASGTSHAMHSDSEDDGPTRSQGMTDNPWSEPPSLPAFAGYEDFWDSTMQAGRHVEGTVPVSDELDVRSSGSAIFGDPPNDPFAVIPGRMNNEEPPYSHVDDAFESSAAVWSAGSHIHGMSDGAMQPAPLITDPVIDNGGFWESATSGGSRPGRPAVVSDIAGMQVPADGLLGDVLPAGRATCATAVPDTGYQTSDDTVMENSSAPNVLAPGSYPALYKEQHSFNGTSGILQFLQLQEDTTSTSHQPVGYENAQTTDHGSLRGLQDPSRVFGDHSHGSALDWGDNSSCDAMDTDVDPPSAHLHQMTTDAHDPEDEAQPDHPRADGPLDVEDQQGELEEGTGSDDESSDSDSDSTDDDEGGDGGDGSDGSDGSDGGDGGDGDGGDDIEEGLLREIERESSRRKGKQRELPIQAPPSRSPEMYSNSGSGFSGLVGAQSGVELGGPSAVSQRLQNTVTGEGSNQATEPVTKSDSLKSSRRRNRRGRRRQGVRDELQLVCVCVRRQREH